MLRSLFATALLLLPLTAQNSVSSYVQDTVTGFSGNIAPLGCGPTGLAVTARSQILIPAAYLGCPNAILTGLAAVGNNSSAGNSTITYASLRITVSRTNATSLSPTFANNLPLPQVVLNATNLTVNYVAGTWTPIQFSTSYLHDGTSNLVVEIQKVVSPVGDATMRTIANSGRTDLPRMINVFGGVGSSAHLAATATVLNNSPMAMQLRWGGVSGTTVPTVRLKSDTGGAASNQFAIGTNVLHTVQGAPGALFVNMQALALLNPSRPLPPVVGRQWVDGITVNLGLLPANGLATFTWALPANPSMVGLYSAFQALVSPAPFAQLYFSNVADCFVRS